MLKTKILSVIGGILFAAISPSNSSDVKIGDPPATRVLTAVREIWPAVGRPGDLGGAIAGARGLLWAKDIRGPHLHAEISDAVSGITRLETENAALRLRGVAVAAPPPAALLAELRDARDESARFRAQVGVLTAERDALRAARDDIQRRLDAMAAERDGLRAENIRLVAQLADLRREREAINRELARITAERDAALAQNNLLTRQVEALTRDRDALRAGQAPLIAAREAAEKAAEVERVRYIRLDQEHQAAQRRLAELEKERVQFIKEKAEHADKTKALQEEIDRYKDDLKGLTAEVERLNGIIRGVTEGQPHLVKAFANPYETLSKTVAPLLSPIGYDLRKPGDFTKVIGAAANASSPQHLAAKEALDKLRGQFGILPTTDIGEVMNVLGQMAEAQLAVDPKSPKGGVGTTASKLSALRIHPHIAATPGESLIAAADRARTEVERTEKIKRAMMGAGFLAVEKPYDTLDIIGQVISSDGTYGRTGGEKQIPVNNIDEIVKAVHTLAGKEGAEAKALLSSIAAGMGVEVDQLPRVVSALKPWAILTESLKGFGTSAAGSRDVFNELKGVSVRRTKPPTIAVGTGSPKGAAPLLSPVIKSPTHPDSMDTVFAFAELIRRQVEEQHSLGKMTRPEGLAAWMQTELRLRRHTSGRVAP